MLSVAARLVEPAKVILVVGIAYTLAAAGWYFFSTPAPDAVAATPAAVRTDTARTDIHRITSRNLFGIVDSTPMAAAPQVYDAPQTRLRLTLEGLFQADDPKRSAAIVAERNQPGELFLVGDRLPGDAVLAEVHHDRIVLQRGAVFETLRFSDEPSFARARGPEMPLPDYDEPLSYDEPDYSEEPLPIDQPAEYIDEQARRPAPVRSQQAALRETVQHYRERLDQDPEGTLSELGVAPVAEDSAAGYRLGALAENPVVRQAGLQSGDVILSVNGNPIGNVAQDRQQIEHLIAEGSVRLEVQRGNRRMFITTSLQ